MARELIECQSIGAEALMKQAAEYLGEAELTTRQTASAGPSAAMELLHRYSELKQRLIAERFGVG